jgi:hypothetical protein
MDILKKDFIYFNNVYTMETFVLNFIPSATIEYDSEGRVIINTNMTTDDEGTLILCDVQDAQI